jgi:hypothetical protein
MTEVLLGANTHRKAPARVYAEAATPTDTGSEW